MQLHFFHKTYLFKVRVGIGIFWGLFLVLFCALGVWQAHRYEYKKELLASYQNRMSSQPIPFEQLVSSPENNQFQSVKVKGQYINELTLLIQNRFYKDQPGFEVLTPFKIANTKKLVLIDRGWIPQSDQQKIEKIEGEQEVMGYLKLLDRYQFTLGENILNPTVFPLVIQKIDIDQLNQITHQSFYPFIIRLNATQPNGFVREWVITTMTPERHLAYAVQWFAMALVLFIAYFCFCCEQVKNDRKK